MYKIGQWKVVCDSCGFEFMNTELKERWDGLMVCDKDWETRHPQEFVRAKPERAIPSYTRPANDVTQQPVLWVNGTRRVDWVDGIATVDWYKDI